MYELTIDASPRQASVGQEIRVHGELRLIHEDGTYDPIAGQEIKLHVISNGNDIVYSSTKTNENGEYEFIIKFNTAGTYIIYTSSTVGSEEGNEKVDYTKYIMAGAAAIGAIVAIIGLLRGRKK